MDADSRHRSIDGADLVAYIDALFVSGNDVPVTTTLFSKASWDIIKEMLADGLALDYHVVEAEAVYRRKLAAYGDETRATSPLAALRAKMEAEKPQRWLMRKASGIEWETASLYTREEIKHFDSKPVRPL